MPQQMVVDSKEILNGSEFQQLGPGLHYHKPTRLLLQTNTKPIRFFDPKEVDVIKPELFDEYRYINFDAPQGWSWSELYSGFAKPEESNFSLMDPHQTLLSLIDSQIVGVCDGCGKFCFNELAVKSPKSSETYQKHLEEHPLCASHRLKIAHGFTCSRNTPTFFLLKDSHEKKANGDSPAVKSTRRKAAAKTPVNSSATASTLVTNNNNPAPVKPNTTPKHPNSSLAHQTPEAPSKDATMALTSKSLVRRIKTPPKEPAVNPELEKKVLESEEFVAIGPTLHYHKPSKMVLITGRWPTRLFDPTWSSPLHMKNLLYRQFKDMDASSWSELYSTLRDPENHNFHFADLHPTLKSVVELKHLALCKGCEQMAFNFSASRFMATTPYIRHVKQSPSCRGGYIQMVQGYMVSLKPRTFFLVKNTYGEIIDVHDLEKDMASTPAKGEKSGKTSKPKAAPVAKPLAPSQPVLSKESRSSSTHEILAPKPKQIILPSQRQGLAAPVAHTSVRTPGRNQDSGEILGARRSSDADLAGPNAKRAKLLENGTPLVNGNPVLQTHPHKQSPSPLHSDLVQQTTQMTAPQSQQHKVYVPPQSGMSWTESVLIRVSQELDSLSASVFQPPHDSSFQQSWTQLLSTTEPSSVNILPFMLLSCVKDYLHQTFENTNSFKCILYPTHPQLDITDVHSTLKISLQLTRTPGTDSTWSIKGNVLTDADTQQVRNNKFLQLDRFEAEELSFIEVCEFIIVQRALYRSLLNAVSETGYIPSKRELSEVMWSCIDEVQVDKDKVVKLVKCELSALLGFFPQL